MANRNHSNRSTIALLAAIGGILIIVGGILGFFLSFGPYGYRPNLGTIDLIVLAILAVIFGILILMFSGYTHYQGLGQGLSGGIAFIVLGIITWAIAGAWLLVVLGSALTLIAGLVLVIMVLMRGPNHRTP